MYATEHVLENEHVRIELDPDTGWIRSYADRATGVDLMRDVDGSTHTQVCADPTDTWGHRVVSYNWPGSPMRTTRIRIRIRENGPLRAVIRVERAWNASTLAESSASASEGCELGRKSGSRARAAEALEGRAVVGRLRGGRRRAEGWGRGGGGMDSRAGSEGGGMDVRCGGGRGVAAGAALRASRD